MTLSDKSILVDGVVVYLKENGVLYGYGIGRYSFAFHCARLCLCPWEETELGRCVKTISISSSPRTIVVRDKCDHTYDLLIHTSALDKWHSVFSSIRIRRWAYLSAAFVAVCIGWHVTK
jgi:hypothetical protein